MSKTYGTEYTNKIIFSLENAKVIKLQNIYFVIFLASFNKTKTDLIQFMECIAFALSGSDNGNV